MNKKCLWAVIACTLMFVACGDDVTEVTEVHKDGMAVLEKGEKLSEQVCDTTNVGEMLFVTDSSEVFFCDGESWQTLKGEKGADGVDGKDGADGKDGKNGVNGKDGEKGSSCTATVNKDGGFDLVCDGEKVGTITNGKDGLNGNNGTSCTAESVTGENDRDGIKVTCDEKVVGTIWNGEKGDAGNAGVGCSLEDDGEGSVSVTCGGDDDAVTTTIYKALCGTKPYDPAKSFCSEGELYDFDLCDGKPYDPKTQFCLEVTRDGSKIYSLEDLLTDSRDNQVYKTVKICNDDKTSCQTWMAQNMNYDYNKGSAKSYCYDGIEANCEVTGRLYTWAAAIDSVSLASDSENPQTCGYKATCTLPTVVKGVCPEGWHLPTKDEWVTLFNAVGGLDKAGTALKSQTGWKDNGNGEDSYGFSAFPVGIRRSSGDFWYAGEYTHFWFANQYGNDNEYAYQTSLNDSQASAYTTYGEKRSGFSVRCVQNN